MPKPFANKTGNGCHCHVSVWDLGNSKNLFLDARGELVSLFGGKWGKCEKVREKWENYGGNRGLNV